MHVLERNLFIKVAADEKHIVSLEYWSYFLPHTNVIFKGEIIHFYCKNFDNYVGRYNL